MVRFAKKEDLGRINEGWRVSSIFTEQNRHTI